MSTATESIAENLEKLVKQAVEAVIDEESFLTEGSFDPDEFDLVRTGDVMDHVDIDDIAERVRDEIDIDTTVDNIERRLKTLEAAELPASAAGWTGQLEGRLEHVEGFEHRLNELERQLAPLLRVLAAFKVVP